jgi:putative FmdB family regulatory protein
MPIYEFECPQCSRKKELVLSINKVDTEVVICDECHVDMDRIEFSNSTFILKGGGWAATGYSK